MATEYALCYCKGKVSPQALEYVRKALTAAKPAMLLDSSYFLPWLLPASFRLFTPVSYTQRPAVAAAKLCEGKILVMVNGSPSALVLPALFSENFECLDDYGTTAFFSSFLRILKYASFALTVFLPGAFVCIAVYLPELLPPQLLYRIAAAEKATPMPLFAEMVMVILILEVIREAGLRMPQTLGHSVSLVAALVIGDAAISAGLMSTPVILVASITSIAVFVTPSLYESATVLRLGVVFAAGLAGPVGLAASALLFLLALSSVSALGVPYLSSRSTLLRMVFCGGTTVNYLPHPLISGRREETSLEAASFSSSCYAGTEFGDGCPGGVSSFLWFAGGCPYTAARRSRGHTRDGPADRFAGRAALPVPSGGGRTFGLFVAGCMAGSRADSAAVAGTPALLAAVLLTGGHWAGTGSALDRMVLRSAKS